MHPLQWIHLINPLIILCISIFSSQLAPMNGAILNIHETDSMEDGSLKRLRAQVTDVEVCSYSLKVGRFTAKACRQTPWSLGWIQRRGWGSGHGSFLVQTPFPGQCLGRVPASVWWADCRMALARSWHTLLHSQFLFHFNTKFYSTMGNPFSSKSVSFFLWPSLPKNVLNIYNFIL